MHGFYKNILNGQKHMYCDIGMFCIAYINAYNSLQSAIMCAYMCARVYVYV